MKERILESKVKVYKDINETEPADRELIQSAMSAAEAAYAPYSKFHVGAAIRLNNGIIIEGNNQENAAYPSGLCAERVALFHAGAVYPDNHVTSIAITAHSENYKVSEPVIPCGACLQVISETEKRGKEPIRIILSGETGEVMVAEGSKNFLPFQFALTRKSEE